MAEALQVPLAALYAALGHDGPRSEDVCALISQKRWDVAYHAIQQMQLDAYKTGDTAVLAHAHELMSRFPVRGSWLKWSRSGILKGAR